MQERFTPFFPGNRLAMKLARAHTIAAKGTSVLSKELFASCKIRSKPISTIYFNVIHCTSLAPRCSGISMNTRKSSLFTLMHFTMQYKVFVYLVQITLAINASFFFFFLVSKFRKPSRFQSVCCMYVLNEFVNGVFINVLLRLICYSQYASATLSSHIFVLLPDCVRFGHQNQ